MKRLLFILIMISLLSFSCTTDKPKEPIEQDNESAKSEVEEESEAVELSNYQPWSIKAYLAELDSVFSETWSPDGKTVAYIIFDQLNETGKLNIWKAGEKEPKIVRSVKERIDTLYWSPDSNYIIADVGTSSLRLGIIVDAIKCTKVDSINYFGKPVWSPDGKWLALGQVRAIDPPIAWELDGTVDLTMYNVESQEIKVLKEGNQKEYYKPLNWQKDGVLEYTYLLIDGSSQRQWYLPSEETFRNQFEKQIVKKYNSPSKSYEIILIKNSEGYYFYCQNEDNFALIKHFSYVGDSPNVSWSPGEKYVILQTGISKISHGYIFDLINAKGVGSIDYLSGPFWSPTGDYLGITRRGDAIPDAGDDGPFYTTDLYIYDMGLTSYSDVLKGTEDFYYTVEGWDKEGVKYSKRTNADGKVLENGNYVYARNIISWNLDTGEQKVLEKFVGSQYAGFNYSADKKWISLIKNLPSAGEAFPGIPAFYNTETKEIKELDVILQVWFDWAETFWFNHSPKVIINQKNLFDIDSWEMKEINAGENERILAAKPSPNDTKIAAFTYYREENTIDDMGIPLNLNIFDNNGKNILNKYETDLLPFFNNNTQSLLPVNFTWLGNDAVVLENWREQYEEISDIYKIDINSGQTIKLVENAHTPIAAPDGTKIAVMEMNGDRVYFPQTIRVINSLGNTVKVLNCKDFALGFFDSEMIWSGDSEKLIVIGYEEEDAASDQFVVIYDMETEKSKVLPFNNNEFYYDGKHFLDVNEDATEIIFSQMGSLETY